ncbi:MAG TPA: RIP metalloprotease RseP, partial [Porphyromonadaceae bacterium]|nr:RIP metalloprotease RseP [Porphyromonadaceae bacterium]
TPGADDVADMLSKHKNEAIEVGIYRSGNPLTLTLTTDTAGHMGIYMKSPMEVFETVTTT